MNLKSLIQSCAITAAVFTLASTASAQVVFDPASSWVLTGGAINDGNYVYVPGAGTATVAGAGLTAGNYNVSSKRSTNSSGTFSYNVSLGGVNRINDQALGAGADETINYLGYYISPGSSPEVQINGGGASYARVKNLTFTPTSSVYFDENTSGLSLGSGSIASIAPNSLKNSAGYNGIYIAPSDSVSGTVTLTVGQQYQVNVSRQMTDNYTFDFALYLGGSAFATVVCYDAGNSLLFQENGFGLYTATSAITAVSLNGGSGYGRLDYVSFTAVPEPATWVLLTAGLCTVIFLRRRRMV